MDMGSPCSSASNKDEEFQGHYISVQNITPERLLHVVQCVEEGSLYGDFPLWANSLQ